MKFYITLLQASVVFAAVLTVASFAGYQENSGRVIAKREFLENQSDSIENLSLNLSTLPIVLSSGKEQCKIYSKVNGSYENTRCSVIGHNDHLVRQQFECRLVRFEKNSTTKVSEHNCDTSEETSKYYLSKGGDKRCYPVWKRLHKLELSSNYLGIFDTVKECSDEWNQYQEKILDRKALSLYYVTDEWKCVSTDDADVEKMVDDLNAPTYHDVTTRVHECFRQSWRGRINNVGKVGLAALTNCASDKPNVFKIVKSCRGYQDCKWVDNKVATTKENYKEIMKQEINTDPVGLFCILNVGKLLKCSSALNNRRKINNVCGRNGSQELRNGIVIANREVIENPTDSIANLSLNLWTLPIILPSGKKQCKVYSKVNGSYYEKTTCSVIRQNDHLVREQFECRLVSFEQNSTVNRKVPEHNCDTSEETSKYYLSKRDERCYPVWNRLHRLEYFSNYLGIFDTFEECSDEWNQYQEKLLTRNIFSQYYVTPEWKCVTSEDGDHERMVDDLNAPTYHDSTTLMRECFRKSWRGRINNVGKVGLATLANCASGKRNVYKIVKSCNGYQDCTWVDNKDAAIKENYQQIMEQERNTDPVGLFCIRNGENLLKCSSELNNDRKINTVCGRNESQELRNGIFIENREVLENTTDSISNLSLNLWTLPIILPSDKKQCKVYSKVNRSYENTTCSVIVGQNDHLVREQFECRLVSFEQNTTVNRKVPEHNCDTSEETSKYYLSEHDERCYPVWKRFHKLEYFSNYLGIFDTFKECSDEWNQYQEKLLTRNLFSQYYVTQEWKCVSSEDGDPERMVDDLNAPTYHDLTTLMRECFRKSWRGRINNVGKVGLATLTNCASGKRNVYKIVKSCNGYEDCTWVDNKDAAIKENYKQIMEQELINTDSVGLFCMRNGEQLLNCTSELNDQRKINTVCGKNESKNRIELRVATVTDCLKTSKKFYSKVPSCKGFESCTELSEAKLVEMGLEELYKDEDSVYARCDANNNTCAESETNINAICRWAEVRG